GVTFLIYDSLNMLSICFAALILGLGVDFSIHLLTRFMDEMDEHNEITLAFRHTFVHTGKAVILGCLTTAAAFFSLLCRYKDTPSDGCYCRNRFNLNSVSSIHIVTCYCHIKVKIC
ncbi:MAG: MMPL family transporter, partial [Methanomicrobia archaeon]|nr:MMPL family transporter [Methanomicrobia archaeon]